MTERGGGEVLQSSPYLRKLRRAYDTRPRRRQLRQIDRQSSN